MGDIKPVYLEEKLKEVEESGRLDYRSKTLPTWCPGCGYFSIVEAVAASLCELGIPNENAVVVSGIGCSSRFPFFVNTYGMHTLHGRALPVATGVKTANDALTVVAVGGDGDGFAIGGGHVPHAARRNVDMTYLLFDNGIYGLTKGQTSPTSAIGFRTPTSPYENPDRPLNPLLMVLAYGASWVGQAYAGRPDHLNRMITQAMAHRGFSYLHILSPCVTFDKTHPPTRTSACWCATCRPTTIRPTARRRCAWRWTTPRRPSASTSARSARPWATPSTAWSRKPAANCPARSRPSRRARPHGADRHPRFRGDDGVGASEKSVSPARRHAAFRR